MKKELELILVRKFPNLFRWYGGDIRITCMGWGFSCGDGWFNIIYEIGNKLYWNDLENVAIAMQVKEKFGELRFYVAYDEDELQTEEQYDLISSIINRAEEQSSKTCEVCGKPGKLRGDGWLSTQCDECYDKKLAGYEIKGVFI